MTPDNKQDDTDTATNGNHVGDVLDLIVVGGGVVGLAIARHAAALTGYQVAVVEQEADLLVWASGSNSGIICTGVDAAIGTLERALIRDSLAQLRTFYRDMNLPLRSCGSLVCQWDDDRNEQECSSTRPTTCTSSRSPTTDSSLQRVWMESQDAGDVNAQLLTPAQVLDKEPHLNPNCRGAVHIPGEIVVDPWLHGIAYAVHARQNGAQIFTKFQLDMTTSSFDPANKIWTLQRKRQPASSCWSSATTCSATGAAPENEVPTELRARVVVNAAGLWADLLQRDMLGNKATNKPPWEASPRRGQYRVFQYNYHRSDDDNNNNSSRHNASPCVLMHPIQPIPTNRTKGIFVFSTLYNHIVVGPTATDQSSRTDRSIDPDTAQELENTLHRIVKFTAASASPPSSSESNTFTTTCGSVPTEVVVGDYVGIRPGSNHRDYQIHLIPNQNWLTCAGIRSTGLTASLGIGRHVVQLLQSVGILSLSSDGAKQHTTKTVPLPPVSVLAQAYRESGNRESISIDGYEYRVTHPLTRWGWAAGAGLAAPPNHVEHHGAVVQED